MSSCASWGGRVLAALALPTVLLTACGAESSPAPEASSEPSVATSSSTAASLPDCSEIWVVGQRLPGGYAGCQEDGASVEEIEANCSMGDRLIQHGTDLYATPGRQIRQAEGGFDGDAAFQRILAVCTG